MLNGAASNLRFVKEFPEAADKIMDCNHWYDPRKPAAVDLLKRCLAANKGWNYNIPMNYSAVGLPGQRAGTGGSTDRPR